MLFTCTCTSYFIYLYNLFYLPVWPIYLYKIFTCMSLCSLSCDDWKWSLSSCCVKLSWRPYPSVSACWFPLSRYKSKNVEKSNLNVYDYNNYQNQSLGLKEKGWTKLLIASSVTIMHPGNHGLLKVTMGTTVYWKLPWLPRSTESRPWNMQTGAVTNLWVEQTPRAAHEHPVFY